MRLLREEEQSRFDALLEQKHCLCSAGWSAGPCRPKLPKEANEKAEKDKGKE